MPASTVNRNYPYSVPGDPADVAGALQALAEAVDADIGVLDALASARPMARVSATTPFAVSGLTGGELLPWETTDFNHRGAIAPLVGNPTSITVNETGFWFILSTAVFSTGIPATTTTAGIAIEVFFPRGEVSTHNTVFLTDQTRMLDAGAGIFMNAGDAVQLRGLHDQDVSNPTTYRDRSLTLMRMTQS